MQQRAVSALLFVPPLVVVLVLGMPWIALGLGILAALAAREVFRILGGAGLPSMSLLGIALATTFALEAGAPAELADKAALLLAVGVVLAAVGAFSRTEPRVGLLTWVATVFGAIYVGSLGFVARLGVVAPDLDPNELVDVALGPLATEETRLAVARAESKTQALTLLVMAPEFQRR